MSKAGNFDEVVENLVHDLKFEYRAELIVRAVNSHAALVEALEQVEKLWNYRGDDISGFAMDTSNKVRAALTLAKGA